MKKKVKIKYIIIFQFYKNIIELTIHLDDLQYENHLKTIIYLIDSRYIQKDKDKEKSSGSSKNAINSFSENSLSLKNITDTNSGEKKNKISKNCIKLIITERPNTIDETKLLTVTMIDYSESLNENQLKNIVQYVFNNLQDSLRAVKPINKNSESVIINANINTVFFFFANWRTRLLGNHIVKDITFNGDPKIPKNNLELTYLNKYRVKIIVEEVNSYIQKENEESEKEWNYKYTLEAQKSQSECLNCIFISCENATKTLVAVENDINENLGIERIQELSDRKLKILSEMKKYIENNLVDLKKLSDDEY